jgi:hypothetical protein
VRLQVQSTLMHEWHDPPIVTKRQEAFALSGSELGRAPNTLIEIDTMPIFKI